jgi:hypothetical protein
MKTPQEQAIEVAEELAQASQACLVGNAARATPHLEAAGALIADLIEELGEMPVPFKTVN